MKQKTKPADALRARIAGLGTEQLIYLHGETLARYYAVPLDQAPPHMIVVDYIAEELVRREVPMTECCYCPEGHHDTRTCDRTAPNPLTEAADLIMEGIARVH